MKFFIGMFFLAICSSAYANKQPNILYIFTDDQSDRTVSSYERSRRLVQTPNIDQLAKTGVRFRNMHTGTWCMPSRATFLTGKLQYGVESMRMEGPYPGSTYDPQKTPFWMKSFKKAGYTTAQIGKWHTGADSGYGRDWDYQIVWNRPKLPENSWAYYYDQMISFNGEKEKLIKGYSTDNYTKWAKEYIQGKGRDKNKPWLLWLCYSATHGPFTPAPRHDETIDKNLKIPFPDGMFGPFDGKPSYVRHRTPPWKKAADGKYYSKRRPPKGGEWHESVKNYHETALGLDEAVGKLVETLKETGQWENTLIIYTSDQGFAWGQHGIQHKMAPYDASLSSPLIFSYPGVIPAGKVNSTPIGGHDIVPTIFKYAGVKLPWKMHGKDISHILQKPNDEYDHSVLLTYTGRKYGSDTAKLPTKDDFGHNGISWWVSYRQHNFKYIMNLIKGEVEELYDLEKDPGEMVNLAMDKKYAQTLKKYRRAAIKEMKRTDAPFVKEVSSWF